MRDSPAKPTSAARRAMSRSHAEGSVSQGKVLSWRNTPSSSRPRDDGATVVARCGSGAGASVTTWTRSQPSPSSSPTTVRIRRSWVVSTAAGTGRSRWVLRARHTGAGVPSTTATAGSPADRATARYAARLDGSRPRVSTTTVSRRPARAATIRTSRSNESADASRSAGPLPTTSRSASEDTTSAARKRDDAQWDLPDPDAPTRTTRAGSGSSGIRAGQPLSKLLDVELAVRVPLADHLLVELADRGLRDLLDDRPAFRHLP